MTLKENNHIAFSYFDFFIRVLALMHWYWLFTLKYYYFDPANSHRLPIFDFLGHESIFLHQGIFISYTIIVLLFAFKGANYIWSFLIALCLFYFEFHDKYSFHHDIFLGINVFFLFGFIKYYHINKLIESKKDFIFAMKVLCSLVYFFAGLHKWNEFFHSGILLKDMLQTGILRFVLPDVPISIAKALAYFTLFIEFSFPILIWTKWKRFAVCTAVLLHFGVAIFGERGMLFNMYLPCMWILFFSFSKVNIAEVRLKALLKITDTFKVLEEFVVYKKTSLKEFKELCYNFIWINPIFVILFVAFLFNLLLLSKKLITDFF